METTMSTRTLRIDGMFDETCVQKVRAALKDVRDVTTESVRVGGATIACESPGASGAACAAINAAGFRAWETRAPRDRNGADNEPANGREGSEAEPSVASQDMMSEGAGGAIGSEGARA